MERRRQNNRKSNQKWSCLRSQSRKTNVIAKLDWSGQEIKIPLVVVKNEVSGGTKSNPNGEAKFTVKYNKAGDLVYELRVNNNMNKKAYVKYRNLTFGIPRTRLLNGRLGRRFLL